MRFLVVGEVCTDVFVYGRCTRLSPEAPVPVFQPIGETRNRGMAGNVSDNLRALVRRSGESHEVIEWLSNEGGIVKTRYVDKRSNHIFLRVDVDDLGEPFHLSPHFCDAIHGSDVIVVSDYDKGYLSKSDLLTIASQRRDGCIILLDTKKTLDDRLVAAFDYIKLNEHEADRSKDIVSHNQNKIIVTLGGRGARLSGMEYLVDEVETIDVSGAGDTFLASFAFRKAVTGDSVEAVKFANEMASTVVRKRGVTTI